MRKWMILLAAVLMLLAGCGKEPAVAGLSNEEFHRYFAEDYARPMSSITEITEENGGFDTENRSWRPHYRHEGRNGGLGRGCWLELWLR